MDETKKYLVNIESNLKKYAEETAEAKKKVDELTAANKLLKESGTATAAEIETSNAALKNSQDEYRKSASLLKTAIANNQSETGSRKQLSEQLKLQEQALGKLGNAYIINARGQRELNPLYIEQRKRIAETKQAIIDYDLALNDGRSNIGRYGEAMVTAFKGVGQNLLAMIGPAALAAAALKIVMSVFNGIKEAIMSTTGAINTFNIAGAVMKQIFYDIGVKGILQPDMKTISEVITATKELNTLRVEEYKDQLELSKINREQQATRELSIDRTKTHAERLVYLNQVKEDEGKKTAIVVEHLNKELGAIEKLLKVAPKNEDYLKRYYLIMTKINDAYAQEDASMRRIEIQRTSFIQEETDKRQKMFDDWMKEIDDSIEENKRAIKQKQDEHIAMINLMNDQDKEMEMWAKKRTKEREDQEKAAFNRFIAYWDKQDAEKAKRQADDIQAGWEYQKMKAEGNMEAMNTILDQEHYAYMASAEYQRLSFNQKLLDEAQYNEAKQALTQMRIEMGNAELSETARLMGGLSDLMGRQTEENKGFAIAQATINTWLGVTEVLAEKGISTYMKFIKIANVIIEGLAAVKNIAAVNTSGSSRNATMPTAITSTSAAQKSFSTPVGSTVFTQPQLSQPQLNALPSQGSLTVEDIKNIIRSMPNPVVTVEDINARTKQVNKVTVRANI